MIIRGKKHLVSEPLAAAFTRPYLVLPVTFPLEFDSAFVANIFELHFLLLRGCVQIFRSDLRTILFLVLFLSRVVGSSDTSLHPFIDAIPRGMTARSL